MSQNVSRRSFLTTLGVALASQPSSTVGQEIRVRSIGVIIGLANNSEMQERTKAFEAGLDQRGWTPGEYSDRLPFLQQQHGADAPTRKRDRWASTRLHRCPQHTGLRRVDETYADHPGSFCVGIRPDRQWVRDEHGAARRQYDWIYDLTIHNYQQIPTGIKGTCAWAD